MFKITQDVKSDSVYVQFDDKPISHSHEVNGDVLLDLAADDTVVGIDIHNWTAVQQETLGVEGFPTNVATHTESVATILAPSHPRGPVSVKG